MNHSEIRRSLYDFVSGDLSHEQRRAVENHLKLCQDCANDLETIRAIMSVARLNHTNPSTQRTEQFWSIFASNVQLRIRNDAHGREMTRLPVRGLIESWLVLRHSFAVRVAWTCATIMILGAAWIILRSASTTSPAGSEYAQGIHQPDTVALQISQYFRKSRALLLGLSNLRSKETDPGQLDIEKQLSRRLVHEARQLKRNPIDARSSRLLSDLDKILVKFSNTTPETESPDIELVQNGIRRENLLFRLRMAESMYAKQEASTFRNAL